MSFFSRKNCSVCGGKIALLGNRKLDDGNLCKDCAKKLSPLFTDRRRSTVAEIKEQLAYRDANKNEVQAFQVTRTFGNRTKVYIDENAGNFIVTASRRWQDDNPDVISLSAVTGSKLDIDEERTEETRRDDKGNEISYHPPRYIYSYDFYITVFVNSPWFDQIRFQLNDNNIESSSPLRSGTLGGSTWKTGPATSVEFDQCLALGEEIKTALMAVQEDLRQNIAAAKAPKLAQTCPHCGATTTPDSQGKCEYCEGAIGV